MKNSEWMIHFVSLWSYIHILEIKTQWMKYNLQKQKKFVLILTIKLKELYRACQRWKDLFTKQLCVIFLFSVFKYNQERGVILPRFNIFIKAWRSIQ